MAYPLAQKKTIGIIGCGIAGPTLALQILSHPELKKRYTPILFDRGEDPSTITAADRLQTGGAAIGLFGNGLYPLYQLGLKDEIERSSIETPSASFWAATGKTFNNGQLKFLNTSNYMGWAEDINRSVTVIERAVLQAILVKEAQRGGCQVYWSCNLQSVERIPNFRLRTTFDDDAVHDLDLLVGADGAYSRVRKHILNELNPSTCQVRWTPDHCGMSGIYGVSGNVSRFRKEEKSEASKETHAVWFDGGFLSTSPLPNDKLRWDLIFTEPKPFEGNTDAANEPEIASTSRGWESRIVSNVYPRKHTTKMLQQVSRLPDPVLGTVSSILEASERIIHTPLRQKVWAEHEIQHKNIVLVGDAARLLLPSSGQGTSFAIEDATVLANALLNHPPSDDGDFNVALGHYAKERVPRSKKMATMALYAGRLGLGNTWFWSILRSLSVWALSIPYLNTSGSGKSKQSAGWPLNERVKVELKL